MEIEFNNKLKIKNKNVDCSIVLDEAKCYLISGHNGIGKSSFLQYLKLHQNNYLNGKRVCFVDQFPLRPINGISFKNMLVILKNERFEKLDVFDALKEEIASFSTMPVNQLSGGQNQMVKIMISLYLSGDIFVYDEPLQYLDSKNVEIFIEVIKVLTLLGKTILIVEHRSDLLKDVVNKRLHMGEINLKTISIREQNGI
jgi:energy-coupling factor transporter ATP-binding protein EcfA2